VKTFVTRSVTPGTRPLVAYPEPPTTLRSYRSAEIATDPDGRSVMYDTNEAECEAVMPFTLCRSNGGPYADDGFLSGWRLGALDATLSTGGVSALADSIRPVEYAQADLIAMAGG
jgi:hypothetical protein